MKRNLTSLLLSLLPLASVPASAFEFPQTFVKGGLVNTQGDFRDMTQVTTGFIVETGMEFAPSEWNGIHVRPNLGYLQVKGKSGFKPWVILAASSAYPNQRMSYEDYQAQFGSLPFEQQPAVRQQRFTYDVSGRYLGMDIVWPFTIKGHKLDVFTGPSLHEWYVHRLNPDRSEGDNHVRVGWRLGFDYQVLTKLDVSVAYTQTEWRSKTWERASANEPLVPSEDGANPSRPAYVTITATYRF